MVEYRSQVRVDGWGLFDQESRVSSVYTPHEPQAILFYKVSDPPRYLWSLKLSELKVQYVYCTYLLKFEIWNFLQVSKILSTLHVHSTCTRTESKDSFGVFLEVQYCQNVFHERLKCTCRQFEPLKILLYFQVFKFPPPWICQEYVTSSRRKDWSSKCRIFIWLREIKLKIDQIDRSLRLTINSFCLSFKAFILLLYIRTCPSWFITSGRIDDPKYRQKVKRTRSCWRSWVNIKVDCSGPSLRDDVAGTSLLGKWV